MHFLYTHLHKHNIKTIFPWIFKRLCTLGLVLGLVFSVMGSSYQNKIVLAFSPPPSDFLKTSTKEDMEEAEKQRQKARQEMETAKNKVAALRGETDKISAELSQLNELNAQEKALYEEISLELQAAIDTKEAALTAYIEAEIDLENKQIQYSERLSAMYEHQNKSFLDLLLESKDLNGFFTNIELTSLIADSDQQAVEELKAATDNAAMLKEYAQQQAIDMQYVIDAKQKDLDDLANKIYNTNGELERRQVELSQWEKQEQAFNEESKRLDAEIAGLQNKLAAENAAKNASAGGSGSIAGSSGSGEAPNGQLVWPYPSNYGNSSPYGNRVHPKYGTVKFHSGMDIGGSYGGSIVAAADGTVILVSTPVAGQNTGGSGYGNHLVIDHGNGMTTLYAHCKDIYVSVGDAVTAGQSIAGCGSTGTSTGAHLHFEVRINGSRVNPAPYLQ